MPRLAVIFTVFDYGRETAVMRAAPVALSGLLALIVMEILKIVGPPILAWIAGVLLVVFFFVLKVGLGLMVATALALAIWLVYRARRRSEVT